MAWLAIDPGLDTGWAIVSDEGELFTCGVGAPPIGEIGCKGAVIERPEIYPKSPVNPNDIITLAIQVGRYTERCSVAGLHVSHVAPKKWKGQLPKDVHHARIKGALSDLERARLNAALATVAKSVQHNALDAVGLAKWAWQSKTFAR